MRDKKICEKLKYYIDLNIFKDESGEIIDNKVGLVQDLYDFILLDYEKLEEENKKLKNALEDFDLEEDHMKECQWVFNFGQGDVDEECSCMDRSHYNYKDCLERARKLLRELYGF